LILQDAGQTLRLLGFLGEGAAISVLTALLRRARQRAVGQREWLRTVVSGMADGVLVTDTEDRITFLNPLAQKLTGWSVEEAMQRPLSDVLRMVSEQTRRPADMRVDQDAQNGEAGRSDPSLLVAKGGTEVP